MIKKIGKKIWVFPDAELPPAGEFELKGHESVIILNMSKKEAKITLSIYFESESPIENIRLKVAPEKVRCIRMDNKEDLSGIIVPREKQYAIKLQSSVPVVVQYGRLDTRQQNMAFYTCMGYCV